LLERAWNTADPCDPMRRPRGCALIVGLLILLARVAEPSIAADHTVQAGVAQETFVLPRWVPLAGYSRRKGKSSVGTHDPVGVRALVLEDGKTVAALVSCDLLIVDEHLFDAVRARLLAQGFPQDVVLILAATHTHSGPGAYGTRFFEKLSMGHFDRDIFDTIVAAISRAVIRARAARVDVRIASMTTTTEGLVTNRMDPHGLIDPELIVSAFYPRGARDPRAVLVNFSAHPTTLGAWNKQLSADYPGVIVREIERQFPGTMAFFFAGAVGDQAPVKAGEGFERPERLGVSLAQQAIALLREAHPESSPALLARQERLLLPPAQVHLGSRLTFPHWLGKLFVDDDATLSLVAVGKTVFLGVPCDLTAGLGQELKAAARSRNVEPMVIGFASDYIGYCLAETQYVSHSYESSMAFNGPKTGELVVNRLTQMLDGIVSQ